MSMFKHTSVQGVLSTSGNSARTGKTYSECLSSSIPVFVGPNCTLLSRCSVCQSGQWGHDYNGWRSGRPLPGVYVSLPLGRQQLKGLWAQGRWQELPHGGILTVWGLMRWFERVWTWLNFSSTLPSCSWKGFWLGYTSSFSPTMR